MGKTEYLDALKRAMAGLAPETQAKTLAYYEQRFVDGIAAGHSEDEVGRELDDPRKIAMTLRASTHLSAFAEKKNPASLMRLLVSAVGLAIFNLFMVVPAAVFGSLLAALYACAVAFYFGGVVVVASSLAGTNEIVFKEPLRHVVIERGGSAQRGQATVRIGPDGVQVEREKIAPVPGAESAAPDSQRMTRERNDDGRIRIVTGLDASSRTSQAMIGAGMVLGGIALCLMALVVTRYTVAGIRRYVQMNLSLLRGG
jgi:uncharacterized membrane protein